MTIRTATRQSFLIEVPNKLTNVTEALKYLYNLKPYLLTDFNAFNYVKNLETHLQDLVVVKKQAKLHQKNMQNFFKE